MSSSKNPTKPSRFHGAFTGGFSAGYYNTVGSETGWEPSKFVSSRDSKEKSYRQQKPEDFMDEEDGLLGRNIYTNRQYDSFEQKNFDTSMREFLSEKSSIPGPIPNELVLSATNHIGKMLLKKMGWREGQGIGKRRVKQRIENTALIKEEFIPENVKSKFAQNKVTFAPINDEAKITIPKPKADNYGLGYDPYGSDSILFTFKGEKSTCDERFRNRISMDLSKPMKNLPMKSRSLLGYSADDDDDIYETNMIEYDNTAYDDHVSLAVRSNSQYLSLKNIPEKTKQSLMLMKQIKKVELRFSDPFSVALYRSQDSKAKPVNFDDAESTLQLQRLIRCRTDNRLPIEGFVVSTSELSIQVKQEWLPTKPPKSFRPVHTFLEVENDEHKKRLNLIWSKAIKVIMTNDYRGALLGENISKNRALEKDEVKKNEESVKKTTDLIQCRFSHLRNEIANKFTGGSKVEETVAPQVGLMLPSKVKKEESVPDRRCNQNELAEEHERIVKMQPVRTSKPWQPASLLCKRLNVPLPTATRKSRWDSAEPKVPLLLGYENTVVDSSSSSGIQLDKRTRLLTGGTPLNALTLNDKNSNKLLDLDIASKPSIDVFRSIFEPNSGDDGSEDESDTDSSKRKNLEEDPKKFDVPSMYIPAASNPKADDVERSSKATVSAPLPEWANRAKRVHEHVQSSSSSIRSPSESDDSVDSSRKKRREKSKKQKKERKRKREKKEHSKKRSDRRSEGKRHRR